MQKRCNTIKSNQKAACLQKEELMFWERQNKSGDEVDLKLARDLPDDTPEFILRMLTDFEKDAANFASQVREDGYWTRDAATVTWLSEP